MNTVQCHVHVHTSSVHTSSVHASSVHASSVHASSVHASSAPLNKHTCLFTSHV